ERDERDVEEPFRQSDDAVEPLLGRGVEQAELTQRLQACSLVRLHTVAFPRGSPTVDSLGERDHPSDRIAIPDDEGPRPLTPSRPARPRLRTAPGPRPGRGA